MASASAAAAAAGAAKHSVVAGVAINMKTIDAATADHKRRWETGYVQNYSLYKQKFVQEDVDEAPHLFDHNYANRRLQIQKETDALLQIVRNEDRRLPIDLKRHELIPKDNGWLRELELDIVKEKEESVPLFIRKIIPTFYTWDEYRIFLHVGRTDLSFEQIMDTVTRHAPINVGKVDVMAMIEATDTIEPFTKRHFELMSRFSIFLICVPHLYVIRIKRKDDSDVIVSASPLQTVLDLKWAIHNQKGYPIERMDLVFQGQCMNNLQRLFYYDIHDGNVVHLILQTGQNLRIKVSTFWDRVYDLQIDATATASSVLQLIIRQAVSPSCGKYYITENFIQPDFLALDSPRQYHFGHDECVYRTIKEEGNRHLVVNPKRNARPVILKVHNCPEGVEHIRMDDEGHYGIAYLRLHGVIGEYLDNMTLRLSDLNLNPYDGYRNLTSRDVQLDISERIEVKQRKLLLFIVLLSRAVQPLYVNERQTIYDIKEALLGFGYPNCHDYNIYYKNKIVENKLSMYDIDIKSREYLHLVALEFPIFIVSLKGFQRKLNISGRSRLTSITEKSTIAFPPPHGKVVYNFCGKIIDVKQSALQVGIQPTNMLFQEVDEKQVILEVQYFNKKMMLEMEWNNFNVDVRRHFREWRLPEGTLDSLEQLLIWRMTLPNYTESRPNAKPIRVTEEMFHDPKIKPTVDYGKLQSHPNEKKDVIGLGYPVPTYGGIFEMPPMLLHKQPMTIQVNKDDGIMTMLKK